MGVRVRNRAALLALVTTVASGGLLVATASGARAVPTADFSFGPDAPAVAEPVHFTFSGVCDVAPCRIQWRWFRDGGSSLGTAMGEGEELDYAFAASGDYAVVAKVTNATSTHGSASTTRTVVVRETIDDAAPAVLLGAWSSVADAASSGGTHRSADDSAAVASLRFRGRSLSYVARTGPDRGVAGVRVDGRRVRLVDLYAPTEGSRLVTLRGLGAGVHQVQVRATGDHAAASTGAAVTLDAFVVRGRTVEDTSLSIGYGGWRGGSAPDAVGGGVRSATAAGSRAQLRFDGGSVTWLSATGPGEGRARVVIDGVRRAIVDGYAADASWQVAHTWDGLGPGLHTLTVVVLGRHAAGGTGDRVVVDGFVVH